MVKSAQDLAQAALSLLKMAQKAGFEGEEGNAARLELAALMKANHIGD